MGRVKSRFVRAVVETVQQQEAGSALARLRSGLPSYLLRLLSRDVLGPLERDATLDLEGGIELLLAIDRVLSGGSGIVTTRATMALGSRVLSQSSGLVVPGDPVATLQHLRAPFEQPFIDVELHFHARRTPDGFTLDLHLPGRPRATRWLCSAAVGYAKAAMIFSGSGSPRLRLDTELIGDLARVVGRHTHTGIVTLPSPPAPARDERPRANPPRRRSSATNAARDVDEILKRVSNIVPAVPARPSERPGVARVRSSAHAPTPEPPAAASGVRPAQGNAARPRTRKSAI